MGIKLDPKRTIYNADETPVLKDGGAIFTLADALRNVYAFTSEKDTGETKGRKGRLLKQLNSAVRKGVPFDISSKDADFTTECAGASCATVVFVQIDDLINERPTLGDTEEGGTFGATPEAEAAEAMGAAN